MLGTPFAALIETAINALIQRDASLQQGLAPIQGKVIAIRLQATPIELFFIPGAQSVQVFDRFDAEPDTLIHGKLSGFLKLAQGDDDPLFKKDVVIEGDVAAGQAIRKLLAQIDIDWEEELSRYTGDLVAHKGMNLLRGLKDWGETVANKLQLDVAEYLQMDHRDVPLPEQVRGFIDDSTTLRHDVDRLEARVQRLQQKVRD